LHPDQATCAKIHPESPKCIPPSGSRIPVRPLESAFTLLFPVAAGCLLLDLFLSATWSSWYFTTGPVVVRSIRFVAAAGSVPAAETLQGAATSFFLGRTLFRDFGADTYAFRRSLLTGSGLLTSLLEFNVPHHTVVAHGRLSPFAVGFLACWFLGAFSTGSLKFAGMGGLVVAGLFLFDYLHIQRVLSIASKAWSGATA
jgi:hypothetical protein